MSEAEVKSHLLRWMRSEGKVTHEKLFGKSYGGGPDIPKGAQIHHETAISAIRTHNSISKRKEIMEAFSLLSKQKKLNADLVGKSFLLEIRDNTFRVSAAMDLKTKSLFVYLTHTSEDYTVVMEVEKAG